MTVCVSLSVVCLTLCLTACTSSKKDVALNGSFVYTKLSLSPDRLINNDNCIFVSDGKKETKYTLEEYEYVFSVNDYFSGDFCCECLTKDSEEIYIVLFKDGTVEEKIPIPETVDGRKIRGNTKFFAFEDEIFFIDYSCLYRIDRKTKEAELIDSGLMQNFETVSAKSDGTVAYIKDKPNSEDWFLCTYKNGEINEIRGAYSVYGWLDDNKLLITNALDELKVLNVSENKTEEPALAFENIDSNLFYSKDEKYFAFYVWDEDSEDKETYLRIADTEDLTEYKTYNSDKLFGKNPPNYMVFLEKDYTLTLDNS